MRKRGGVDIPLKFDEEPGMRKVVIIVCCIFISALFAAGMDDETKHFLISGVCGAGGETVLHYNTEMGTVSRIALATFAGSIPGLVKEISDSSEEGNEFSGSDMTADVLGSLTGALVSNVINDRLEIRLKAGRKTAVVGLVWKF